MSNWIESYRGWVTPADCDIIEHMTVASYFESFGDACLAIAEEIELGSDFRNEQRRAFATVECYVRFMRELRLGETLHVESAIVGVKGKVVTFGHKLYNSQSGEVAATMTQTTLHFDLDGRRALAMAPETEAILMANLTEWDGPPRDERSYPENDSGFMPSGLSTVKQRELDVLGHFSFNFYIHRFSGACMHAMNAIAFTPEYMREQRRGMSTFEIDIRYLREMDAGDPIRIKSAVTDVGTSSFRIVHKMWNMRTGDLAAQMSQYAVNLDLDARRPTPLPDNIRQLALEQAGRTGSAE